MVLRSTLSDAVAEAQGPRTVVDKSFYVVGCPAAVDVRGFPMVTEDRGRQAPVSSPAEDLIAEAAGLIGISGPEYASKWLDLDQAWAVIESAHLGVFTTLRSN